MHEYISKIHILGLPCWVPGYYCAIFPVVTDTGVNFSLILGCSVGELFFELLACGPQGGIAHVCACHPAFMSITVVWSDFLHHQN